MPLTSSEEDKRIKKLLARYNMVPNLVWTIIHFTPVCLFWYAQESFLPVYIFIASSLLPFFFKKKLLDALQLAKDPGTYKKLGVATMLHIIQNGVIINKLIKGKYPQYKMVRHNSTSIATLLHTSYLFEKFHWICLLFFVETMLYAFTVSSLVWACTIFLLNITYNIYPILLQQYIRLKLQLFRAN
jgi:hypothetical protein